MTAQKIIACFALVFLFSCKEKKNMPAGILETAKMQKVFWDVLRADAFAYNFVTKDSSKNAEAENIKLQQQIFAVHKISKTDFYKSYDYYLNNATLLQPLLDSMIAKAERNKYNDTRGKSFVNTDSLTTK